MSDLKLKFFVAITYVWLINKKKISLLFQNNLFRFLWFINKRVCLHSDPVANLQQVEFPADKVAYFKPKRTAQSIFQCPHKGDAYCPYI